MAEVNISHEKTENKREEKTENKHTYPKSTFNIFDICCLFVSFGTYVADITTDIILVIEYSRCGHIGWAVSTLLLMLLPASVLQLFSLRWHKLDEQISMLHYLLHAFLLGIVHRYYLVLRSGLEARSSKDATDFQRLYEKQSDLSMLQLFESFMESAPQLVLQLYVMLNMGDWKTWTGLSVSASVCSLAWAIAAYTRAMRKSRPDKKRVQWTGLILQTTWRGGMLAARISAMLLFALAFHYWLLLVMGLHWIGMTTWAVLQDTDFCPTVWEERIYNGIVGVIYCFSYFNICEGRSRKRVFTFYFIIIVQNIACLILVISLNLVSSFQVIVVTTVLIVGGTLIGLISMSLYYTRFHPVGPIPCCPLFGDVETSLHPNTELKTDVTDKSSTLRSLKHIWVIDRGCSLAQIEGVSLKSSPRSDDGCTDKKLLLENWIARSGSPTFASVPISQDPIEFEKESSFDEIEFHTVANTPDTSYERRNEVCSCIENSPDAEKLSNEKQKRRGICSPTELGLKLTQFTEERSRLTSSDNATLISSQKRRGICSSDQLVLDLNNIEPLADSINDINVNDDVKLKRRPIYSVGSSNSFNPDVVGLRNLYSVKLIKVNDDKSVCSSIKTEEYMEVTSEVLSAHDYENICAVNIARERWGIRSWEGYTDIETFLHDDSTVRDRRRDTLTSTVTGTSASSEISSSDTAGSPPPLIPSRRSRPLRSRQDDYLDTLVYDLVDCDKRRVQFLDYVEEHEIESNIFIAKPYVDQHGMMFPLGSTLEPIEELEEPAVLTPEKEEIKMTKTCCALVATIDEIRRGNDTDSPRHVYHRTENVWDDDDLTNIPDHKRIQNVMSSKNVAKSLWNIHPVNKNNSVLPENKINTIKSVVKGSKKLPVEAINKENNPCERLNKQVSTDPVFKLNKSTSLITFQKPKIEIADHISLSPKKLNTPVENTKQKKNGNKPRRKFSLLREKFEPKMTQESDILNNSSFEMGSTVNLIDDLKMTKSTTPVITKVVHWNSVICGQNKFSETSRDGQISISDQDACGYDRLALSSLRDKRNIFLKQVLSPPKFNNRNKRQSSSPKENRSRKLCDNL